MPQLSTSAKTIYAVAASVLALGALGQLGMSLLVSDLCDNEIINQVLSPDQTLKAILFTRECGATTRTSYQVSVLNPWDSLSDTDSGNVFVSYGSPSLQWKDNRTLVITRTSTEQIFEEKAEITVWPRFKQVRIEYVAD